MDKQTLIATAKPILFNSEMVCAILDGRKTVARHVCKITVNDGVEVRHKYCETYEYPQMNKNGVCANFFDENHFYKGCAKPYCQKGDILYVRETWGTYTPDPEKFYPRLYFKASDHVPNGIKWHPPISMPKKFARIFLRVTDIRVERLQDITPSESLKEGVKLSAKGIFNGESALAPFARVRDSTINPKKREFYGWNANPWVWVIGFEKIEVD